MKHDSEELATTGVAVIGMVGRFPGAPDLDTFWRNIRDARETISVFAGDELDPYGLPAGADGNPSYVKARGIIDGVDLFDPGFFGYSGRDAILMDPQQRLFLESCWEALEHAGYHPRSYKGLIGVYGGATQSSYQPYLYAHVDLLPSPDPLAIAIANELPFLTTRVSYKLDLKGPSCPVQTACSTSLVAVHLACQGLLNGECDMALAGGVSLRLPQRAGYWYQEESILSPDGHCRSFDHRANGTVFSNGLGVVTLKRLEDALADRDTIYGVIRGSAINNDGSRRASFTAPGVIGQSQVIAGALAAAGVEADTIGYLEAHGTATSLGDSIEIQALTRAFSRGTSRKQYCAIGSVKSNIGHLDAAAGVAGLIKTLLMLRHGQIPPAAMFEKPNPDIHFEDTPYFVNTALKDWTPSNGAPRRAGISSFGFGGTNAHVIVEEPPPLEPTDDAREWQLLVVSAESPQGLERATTDLAGFLAKEPAVDLADAAYTLKLGRRPSRHRRAIACRTAEDARRAIESRDARFVSSGEHDGQDRPVVFMFPGQGSQHVEMARDLYAAEPIFRDAVDECAEILKPHIGADLRHLIYPAEGVTPETTARLTRTAYAQPALFVVEYALARLYMSWGLQPDAMIGHSVGEWVAACLSGVVSLADALRLVAVRGRLMEEMPEGVMLSLPLPESQVRPMLRAGVWLAAVNAPSSCVVAGSAEAIAAFETQLAHDGLEGQRLHTSHAFHSGLMDPAVSRFVEAVRGTALSAPKIPFVSNVSGRLITEAEARDAAYWGRQIRETVRFADGIAELLKNDQRLLVEVGPAQALTTLVRRQAVRAPQNVISSLRRAQEQTADTGQVMAALGRLWVAGARIDWPAFYGEQRRRRVPVPTYAFDRQRYWVSRPATGAGSARPSKPERTAGRIAKVGDWFYSPAWTREALVTPAGAPITSNGGPSAWLLLADPHGVADACAARLRAAGHDVVMVTTGAAFARAGTDRFTIAPFARGDYDELVRALAGSGRTPSRVLNFWGAGADPADASAPVVMDNSHYVLFWSVALLAQALADANVSTTVKTAVVTTGVHDVTGRERLSPGKAPVLGLCRVIPQEHPSLPCRHIDLPSGAPPDDPGVRARDIAKAADTILREVGADAVDATVAYRGGHRWVQAYRPVQLPETDAAPARLRDRGVYLITGGLGDIGLNLAEYLARTVGARLVLVGRSAMPAESEWDEYVRSHSAADPLSRRLARLRRIQSLGGEVLIAQADASDVQAMRAAFAAAEARFGPVNGVIHGAGLVAGDAFRPLLETDEDIVTRQFQPKVLGTCVLDEILKDQPVDFCMLVSSLSAILGGLRYGAYAAANLFLDAFADRRNRTSAFPWISVNWDAWMRAEDEEQLKAAGHAVSGYVMTGAEGVDAFRRILGSEAGNQVVVSTGDLQSRIDQWVHMAALAEAPAKDEAPTVYLQARPNLQTEFVAPRTDLERTLAGIWQSLLGLERVGVNDSFFELGGDSLLGIQLTSAVKKQLGAKVSAVTLFEAPTVAALAALIQSQTANAPQGGAVDASRLRGERRREKQLRAVASGEALGA